MTDTHDATAGSTAGSPSGMPAGREDARTDHAGRDDSATGDAAIATPPPITLMGRAARTLRSLMDTCLERSEAETRIVETARADLEAANGDYERRREEIDRTRDVAVEAAEDAHRRTVETAEATAAADRSALEGKVEQMRATIREKADQSLGKAKKQYQEALWTAETVYEATEDQPRQKFDRRAKHIRTQTEAVDGILAEAIEDLGRWRQRRPRLEDTGPIEVGDDHEALTARLDDVASNAQDALRRLRGSSLPRFFAGIVPFVIAPLPVAVGFVGGLIAGGGTVGTLAIAGAGAGLAVSIVGMLVLRRIATGACARIVGSIQRSQREAAEIGERLIEMARVDRDAAERRNVEIRDRDTAEAHSTYEPIIQRIEERTRHHLDGIDRKEAEQAEAIETRRSTAIESATAQRDELVSTARSWHAEETEVNETEHRRRVRAIEETRDDAWAELERRWGREMDEVAAFARDAADADGGRFPAWSEDGWESWSPPPPGPPLVRFGRIRVDLAELPGGLPEDPRLRDRGPERFDVPAILELPHAGSMLVDSGADGRERSIALLQHVMLRLLTTLPPGKVRFTIVDPVALGQSFAGFMHLADHEAQLVSDRIWTEPGHIEQRLADLTEHMETVIQKYLRNQFETIADYNEAAGEIAEPYRFLVIADFPTRLSENAARRLASILSSGPRCGVFTLIHRDLRTGSPKGLEEEDLVGASLHLVHDAERDRFVLRGDALEELPLVVDQTPGEAFLSSMMHRIGGFAKRSTEVKVPFEAVVPGEQDLWTRRSGEDVRVALGRAGATKLQEMELGHGTNQHCLIAGKTGSGKSTLLHVLVTNAALWYGPGELELYLVDFKKGVEFKTYATHGLPHARVIAIESDREFGLSVLQRLDEEMKARGARYRDLGVQGIGEFRRRAPEEHMPRILLIIDEFQEFFTEDDRVAQEAALLLDRLVRQGRAFGMHVLLGSQTIGGAYSLARSTLGQMGVRIALQCSETDSYLILSEDNAAARLLSRPGEAIYNNASGLVEGNSPFQIVWLPDATRDQWLARVGDLAETRGVPDLPPPIVFEGNVPADLRRNGALERLIKADAWPEPRGAAKPADAFLGEAIRIKDPTAARLRRQAGANLLVVGQQEEPALAMMIATLVGLGLQHAPADASFTVLDGSPPDAPAAGVLGDIAGRLPHDTEVVAYRDVPEAVERIAAEVETRRDESRHDGPARYVLVFGLHRLRQLRHVEDFGFSMSTDGGSSSGADKRFATILGDGPAVGVHGLVWCDTATNLSRTLDRSNQRELGLRVLFQMSSTDSTTLIDTPAASNLGLNRAVFHHEEEGVTETFRPYAVADQAWLGRVWKAMAKRG